MAEGKDETQGHLFQQIFMNRFFDHLVRLRESSSLFEIKKDFYICDYLGVSLRGRLGWVNEPGDDAESPQQEYINEEPDSSVLMAGMCLFRLLEQ